MDSRPHNTPYDGDLGRDFLVYMECQKRCSPLTLRNYTADIKLFEEWLRGEYGDDVTLCDVRAEQVRGWIVSRLDGDASHAPISSASMNRALATLRSLYRWAMLEEHISKSPMRAIKALRTATPLPHFIPRSKMPEVIHPSNSNLTQNQPQPSSDPDLQSASTSDWMAQRDALIIEMLYYTGLRLAEIASIRRSSFNSDFTTLRIVGKGDKQRIIPIIDRLRKKIIAHFLQISTLDIWKRAPESLFLSNRGTSLSSSMIYRIVRRELSEAGVGGRKSPHILRHTFATHLLTEGGDIRVIQELLGHASLQATQRYTHNSIQTLRASYNAAHPRAAKRGEGSKRDEVEE